MIIWLDTPYYSAIFTWQCIDDTYEFYLAKFGKQQGKCNNSFITYSIVLWLVELGQKWKWGHCLHNTGSWKKKLQHSSKTSHHITCYHSNTSALGNTESDTRDNWNKVVIFVCSTPVESPTNCGVGEVGDHGSSTPVNCYHQLQPIIFWYCEDYKRKNATTIFWKKNAHSPVRVLVVCVCNYCDNTACMCKISAAELFYDKAHASTLPSATMPLTWSTCPTNGTVRAPVRAGKWCEQCVWYVGACVFLFSRPLCACTKLCVIFLFMQSRAHVRITYLSMQLSVRRIWFQVWDCNCCCCNLRALKTIHTTQMSKATGIGTWEGTNSARSSCVDVVQLAPKFGNFNTKKMNQPFRLFSHTVRALFVRADRTFPDFRVCAWCMLREPRKRSATLYI